MEQGPDTRKHRLRMGAAIAVTIMAVSYSAIRVDWAPIILPDSLMYLDHSNDLMGVGFVQVGFRQFGYPAFLAVTDWLGRSLGVQPLATTVVAQHLLLLTAIALTVVVLRVWSIPALLVLLAPTMQAYVNFILTEALAVPIAVITAVAVVGIHRDDRAGWIRTWIVLAAVGGATLPMIRLHYGVVTAAVGIAIVTAALRRSTVRHFGFTAVAAVALSSILLVGALSLENEAENGVLFPSLGAERHLFWSTWETVVVPHGADVAKALPDIYLDGSPHTFILLVDGSDATFAEKRARYASALRQIYTVTGASVTWERAKSFAGAISGSRLDDLAPVTMAAARQGAAADTDRYVHQYGTVRPVDVDDTADRYNAGTVPTGVLTISGAVPSIPAPYLGAIVAALVPAATLAGVYLLQFRRPRTLSVVGLTVIAGYALASFAFIMDNLRFLLPGYLFAIVVISGAASLHWGADASDRPVPED